MSCPYQHIWSQHADKAEFILWGVKPYSLSIAHLIHKAPVGFKRKSDGCLCFYPLKKKPLGSCDLYTNHFRSIYLLKIIYIQNENDLYINQKWLIYRLFIELIKRAFRSEKGCHVTYFTSNFDLSEVLIWNHSKHFFVVENFFGAYISVNIPFFQLRKWPISKDFAFTLYSSKNEREHRLPFFIHA